MSRLGLDCNHRAPGGWPDAAELDRLGLRGGIVRTVVHDLDEFARALDLQAGRAEVCALIEGQTEGIGLDPGRWRDVVGRFCARFKGGPVRWVEMENEADARGISVDIMAGLVRLAAPILAEAGFRPILPGVAGPDWQGYLRSLVARLGAETWRLCWGGIHPYVKSAGGIPPGWPSIATAMEQARTIIGRPTVATESGCKVADAGGETRHAEYVRNWCALWRSLPEDLYPFGLMFCYSDAVGSPGEQWDQGFGLRRLDGSKRPAYSIFAAADKGVPMAKYEYVLGMKAEAERLRGLGIDVGEPLEPEQYPFDGALYSIQTTSRGMLVYAKTANRAQFYPAAGR